ncbi:toll-like receptor 2 [Euwallacea similis]|uniref:toll-like receptor 2 n=1 Tax=Euwallacea similis TaxID=1736056 RepID=UPI00344D3C15
MLITIRHVILFMFFLVSLIRSASINCSKEKRCKTTRIHGFRTSDCYNMDFRTFPKCLPSNIDVIELSQNRIRKVGKEELSLYTHLTHLYLSDNLIVNLEDDTFTELSSLETLDLSTNAISKVPASIFELSSLKTLYLSNNMNINIAESIEEAMPIHQSSLTKLDISFITEEDSPTDFPDFTELPLVANLDITGDQFSVITPEHFAKLCNLQILSNHNVTTEFKDVCDCWKINNWLTSRNVQFTPFYCPLKEQECKGNQINQDHLQLFEICKEKVNTFKESKLLGKVGLWLGIVVTASVICGIWIGCYIKRRKNNRTTRYKEVLKLDHRTN